MVYLTHYTEYPIYEPAEGGYYYSGNQIDSYERLSKNQARKKMEEIWEEIKEEYGIYPSEMERWKYIKNSHGVSIRYHSHYIGEGCSYVIERKLGSEKRGWVPYC